MDRIGLVAGYGKLPMIFAREARASGDTVIGLGLKGVTSEELAGLVDRMHWFEWGSLQKALAVVAAERIKKIAMLGKLKKETLFKGDEKLDDKFKSILGKIGNRRDYSILSQVSKMLAPFGIEVIDPTKYLKGLIPAPGVLTKRSPAPAELEDIKYGESVARELARLDIGQAVAVKDKTILAAEAVEGTDELIRRAGRLSKTGFGVVKVARPDQDMRFDIPLVGPDTVRVLAEAGGSFLALESGKTFLMDREEAVALADGKGLAVVII